MLALLLLTGGLARPAASALVERRVAVMGTLFEAAVVAANRESGLAASEAAVEELERVENLLTTWRDSPLARLNSSVVGRRAELGEELHDLLSEVFAWSGRTGGAFDPTVLPLVRAWDLRGEGRVPSARELDEALHATGVGRFHFGATDRTASRLDPRAGIDEGAWGKGYALDRAAETLASSGAAGALLDLGGQVRTVGRSARGDGWSIEVADPRRRDRGVLRLRLENASASTSGNSERSREAGGRRIGHLLDPRTGQTAADFGSVTVVAPSALQADILSTAFFVLGPEEGLAVSARLRREGVPNEVLFLVVDGDALDARYSPGIPELVLSADTSLVRGLTTKR